MNHLFRSNTDGKSHLIRLHELVTWMIGLKAQHLALLATKRVEHSLFYKLKTQSISRYNNLKLTLYFLCGASVASATNEKLLVIHQLEREIRQYDTATGNDEGVWGEASSSFFSEANHGGPQSFSIFNDKLYVACSGDVILRFSMDGNFESIIANPGFGNGASDDIAIDSQGIIYASEHRRGIYHYNQSGLNLGIIDGSQYEVLHTDQIGTTGGLAFDRNNRLFAAVSDNQSTEDRIVYFSESKQSLGVFGEAEISITPLLRAPFDLKFDAMDSLLVADVNSGILKFNENGEFVSQLVDGSFYSIELDSKGNIYAGSKTEVVKFSPEGVLQQTIVPNTGAVNFVDLVVVISEEHNAAPSPPQANAGSNIVATDFDNNGWETVSLNGSNSFDPDGSIESFFWPWENDPSQTSNEVEPTFSFPIGTTSISLVVTDNEGLTATDIVTVEVLSTYLDKDNDGLEDSWEHEHFGDLDSGPDEDPDRDGWLNNEEKDRNTDPNVSDLVRISLLTASTGRNPVYDAFYGTSELPLESDEDGDGVDLQTEMLWGLNPSLADAQRLRIQSEMQSLHPQFSFYGVSGLAYQIEVSDDLVSWRVDNIIRGKDADLSFGSELADENKLFWRISLVGLDDDNDNVSNYQEILLGLNENASDDTDLDLIPDDYEFAFYGNLDNGADSDTDNDGLLLFDEFRYHYDPTVQDALSSRSFQYDYDRLTGINKQIIFSYDAAGNLETVTTR